MARSFLHPQQGFPFSPRKSEPPRTGPVKPTYFLNPTTVASLWKLYQLDLSYNNLSGIIPSSLNHLTHLLTLRLEGNRFSGSISGLSLLSLQDFNVSGNVLAGEIPNSLSEFFALAFEKNSVLCGVSLEKCKLVSSNPTWPWAMASPLSPKSTVASSPSSMPVETKTLVPQDWESDFIESFVRRSGREELRQQGEVEGDRQSDVGEDGRPDEDDILVESDYEMDEPHVEPTNDNNVNIDIGFGEFFLKVLVATVNLIMETRTS
ncbi:Leucine-rich repeat transmembrane protein kinase family protein [Forsythia ovata]|uniref:Leucine-rich repeat transmembrane protein kinase family protein n=1 Tax=Forsythia ovata TaxID=205694 RepID=A0ABD1XCF6_9LAMI